MSLTQAILPVAGLGTRFLPWTKAVPKELLPIGNKPIIALLVDECLSVGITDICFVISKGKESIPHYFLRDVELEAELTRRGKLSLLDDLKKYDSVRFTTVYQHEQKGDGHAILQAADFVNTDEVAILFGDDLVAGKENGLQQLVKGRSMAADKECAILAIEQVPRELVSKYGIVEIAESGSVDRLKKLKGLVEKPAPEKAPSDLAVVGKYIIPKSTFAVLPTVTSGHGGEIRLIDALIAQLGSIGIYGYAFDGKRLDTGRPESYKEAFLTLA